MDCRIIVLPALGGETIRPRCPLPIGAAMSMTRPIMLAELGLEPQPLRGVQGSQLVELDPVAGRVDVAAVDCLEPHERVELLLALPFARPAGPPR